MELTIEEAMQRGIASHKEGKLQEAEKFYRAVLGPLPKHPDANHNLGLILAATYQAEAALPFLKTALEVNPAIETFWVSYISVLICLLYTSPSPRD